MDEPRYPNHTVFLDGQTLDEMRTEAQRLDRSLSKIAQIAWKIARAEVMRMPGKCIKE